jgi:hypothetical protein
MLMTAPFAATVTVWVGITITVVVSQPNAISAVKILKVRKSRAPSITTRCIPPGSAKPVACA